MPTAGPRRENTRGAVPQPSRAALQVVLILLVVVAGAWVLYRLERVVLLVVVAMFFAYVIAPLVRFAEHPIRVAGRPRRLSRGPAIGLVYLVILGERELGRRDPAPDVDRATG